MDFFEKSREKKVPVSRKKRGELTQMDQLASTWLNY
jgi:hypothetical protein